MLFMVNTEGTIVPPLVMYWYQRIPGSVSANFPKDWSIGTSDKGWMTSETFHEYITNVFYPWLKKNNIDFPIVLYVDGHSSHCTFPLRRCETHSQRVSLAPPREPLKLALLLSIAFHIALRRGSKSFLSHFRESYDAASFTPM